MTEEEIKTADAAKELDAQKKTLEGKSTEELIGIIRETRSEAKERRLKEKQLSDELEQIKAKLNEEETQKKIAEGKKDEVILELQQKLKAKDDEYKPIVEKAKLHDEYDSSKRNKLKETLGENWLTSFDNLPLLDLETLASKITGNISLPDTDNGKNKNGGGNGLFTMEQLKSLTPEQLKDKDVLAKANKSMEFHSKK